MPSKMQVRIKTAFGEVVVEGETATEILGLLKSTPQNFIADITSLVSSKLAPPMKAQLEGIVELTSEGPVITTPKTLTHYEAIALILYTLENKTGTASQIEKLLQSSGIKSMVPARLNEMTRRGLVFKPTPSRPEFKLTTQGERWIENSVLPKVGGAKE
jgi:DNA-binding HxlR family transcriptional regulator